MGVPPPTIQWLENEEDCSLLYNTWGTPYNKDSTATIIDRVDVTQKTDMWYEISQLSMKELLK